MTSAQNHRSPLNRVYPALARMSRASVLPTFQTRVARRIGAAQLTTALTTASASITEDCNG